MSPSADYIKFIIDDGTALGHAGQPTLSFDCAKAIVREYVYSLNSIFTATDLASGRISTERWPSATLWTTEQHLWQSMLELTVSLDSHISTHILTMLLGLIHVFYDVASAPDVIEKIAKAGIWVTTTISTLGALAGEITGTNIGSDENAM